VSYVFWNAGRSCCALILGAVACQSGWSWSVVLRTSCPAFYRSLAQNAMQGSICPVCGLTVTNWLRDIASGANERTVNSDTEDGAHSRTGHIGAQLILNFNPSRALSASTNISCLTAAMLDSLRRRGDRSRENVSSK